MGLEEREAELRYLDAYRTANAATIGTPAFEVAMRKLRLAWQELQALRPIRSRGARRTRSGAG